MTVCVFNHIPYLNLNAFVSSSSRICHIYLEFSSERCATPNLNADIILQTFARTCYEFHVTRGESFDKAQQICKSHGKYI